MKTKLIAMILGVALVLSLATATVYTQSVFALSTKSNPIHINCLPGKCEPPSIIIKRGTDGAQLKLGNELPLQLGNDLAGQTTKSALGDVCLSCWNGLAAHETQQVGNVLSGELGHVGVNLGTGAGLLDGGGGAALTTSPTGSIVTANPGTTCSEKNGQFICSP